MLTKTIEKLYAKTDLCSDESEALFNAVFDGQVSDIGLASILTALKVKGETADEISGAALSMRHYCVKPELNAERGIDTCGTGGDSSHSFNVSTAVAVLISAMGYPLVKHGNRSVSSKSGSADFLEALGIPVNLKKHEAELYFQEHNFVFLFAPNYHPAMRHAMSVRKELKTRSIFNYLGPLCNPAGLKQQAIGVFHPDFLPLYAQAAKALQYQRLLVYSGKSGMDEVSPYEATVVYDIHEGACSQYCLHPEKYISRNDAASLPQGLTATENAKLFLDLLTQRKETALSRFIALNAALSLKAAGHSEDFNTNYHDALDALLTGLVLQKLVSLQVCKGVST